jgi:cytidine deaminase
MVGSPDDHHDPVELAAWNAVASAYAPYSDFHVGAAVRTGSGAIYSGCNVENASYAVTLCAERNAVAAAIAAEGSKVSIEEIVVVTPDSGDCAPCGMCRQVLIEFGPALLVRFLQHGRLAEATSAELLPYAFTPSNLP